MESEADCSYDNGVLESSFFSNSHFREAKCKGSTGVRVAKDENHNLSVTHGLSKFLGSKLDW